jgi:LysM repeat protein
MDSMKKYSLVIFLFISMIAFSTKPLPTKYPFSTEIIMHDNHVLYVKAVKGDSYYKIAKRHNITLRQLHKYNEEFPNKDMLEEGSIIYLGPRRNHSRTHKFVVLDQSMTLRELAQKEAVKLKPMMRKNQISSPDEQLPKGEKIILR